MKRTLPLAALVAFASVLMLSSCDAMFDTNLFKAANLGQFDLAKADLSSASGVQAAAESSPEAFYTQLADDPAAKTEAIASLQASGTDSDLVLAAAIEIKTTDAGAVVDNLSGQIPNLVSSTTQPDMGAIIAAVLPSSIDLTSPTPPAAFSDLIAAFQSVSPTFVSLSSSGTLAAIPGGTSQDTAYYGLAALAVSAVGSADTLNYPTATDALWAVVSGQASSSILTFDQTNFNMSSSTSPAYTLLVAAGIDPASFQ